MCTHATIWTIGHWTCPEETFVGLLRSEQIERVYRLTNPRFY
jgi:hypothetical protein